MPNKYETQNLDYQGARSADGGSYTLGKLARLQLPPLEGKRVLDLGCNTGFYCRHAHESGAASVTGVDASKSVIERARSLSPAEIVFRDTGWDDYPEGSYDIVLFLSAIHYAKNPGTVVDNIFRTLRSGGVFVLEGGIVFANQTPFTDIPLPGWRKVGDFCRHLSWGYLKRHLLNGFDWKIVGESEMRGGDNVPRYVIHATPSGARTADGTYQLDLVEYLLAARQSSSTIVEAQPSFAYVSSLAQVENIDTGVLVRMLSDTATFDRILADVEHCLKGLDLETLNIKSTGIPSLDAQIVSVLSKNRSISVA